MSIFTGADVSADRTEKCDVCIVGSGAGGAVVAQRLAQSGKRVIVLEEGGFHTSDTFDLVEQHMYRRLYQEWGGRATVDRSIAIVQGRAVGGTTVVNWTTCFRTPDRVLAHWAEHHGAERLTPGALAPHFQAVEQRLNVQQMQLSQVNRNNRVLWDGAKALGYDVRMVNRNVKRCAHTGYCGMGCPIDAKQSMLVTFIPDALRLGADVYANAGVHRIEGDGRRIQRAIAHMRDPKTDLPTGVSLTVQADLFVLSGGAINTPAVLLRSGLNRNGRTGKRTYLHPTTLVAGVHDELVEGYQGSPQYVACHEFEERANGRMGYLLEASPVFPVGTAGSLFASGYELQDRLNLLPHISENVSLLHDGFDLDDPDEGGSVALHDNGSAVLSYKWNARMIEALRHSAMTAMRIQFAAGARYVQLFHAKSPRIDSAAEIGWLERLAFGPGEVGAFSAHVMGGCAMGKDPATSVVAADSLRHHEFDNLFVVDGSVFPTAATVNPQMTIYGLASWVSETLRSIA